MSLKQSFSPRASMLVCCVLVGCSNTQPAPKPAPAPLNGRELLSQMHDAYAGKWYRTLTFVQKTTMRKPDGSEQVTTWYESLQSPDRLRIDFGNPSEGNGVVYTADSLYVVKGGKLTRSLASGNPFLPFVAGVYTQPVETTLRQLAPYNFDLTRLRSDTWQNRPVYVIGATGPEDLTSPQFWIDRERLIAVRMLVKLSPAPAAKPFDIRLDDNVPVGSGWLATKVVMLDNGVPAQTEQYSDWKANPPLPAVFFDAAQWTAVPHWAQPAK